jgi:hypothetical protein
MTGVRQTSRWKPGAWTSGLIILFAVTLNLLSILAKVDIEPHVHDGTSWIAEALDHIFGFQALLFFVSPIAFLLFIFQRYWLAALAWFSAFWMTFASQFVVSDLLDDRHVFPTRSHREIADIFGQRSFEFRLDDPRPHLVNLHDRCHPPQDCECLVLVDPSRTSSAEKEIGGGWLGNGWHRPTISAFLSDDGDVIFALVNVQRLGSGAYSVMGCRWAG